MFPYVSIWFHTLFSSPGFLTVHSGDSRWALPRVRWAAWRFFGSRCTCGRSSPLRACWGIGCVRPPSWAPPPRAVGSRGRGFPQDWTVCPFLRRLSAIRLPIMPHISFHFWLERMNSASLACDSRREKKYWNDGLVYAFCRFREKKRQIFRASALFWHAWRGDFADDLSRFCILSYSRVCCKLLVISLWEGTGAGGSPGALQRYSVTIKFQEVMTLPLIMYIYLIYK